MCHIPLSRNRIDDEHVRPRSVGIGELEVVRSASELFNFNNHVNLAMSQLDSTADIAAARAIAANALVGCLRFIVGLTLE